MENKIQSDNILSSLLIENLCDINCCAQCGNKLTSKEKAQSFYCKKCIEFFYSEFMLEPEDRHTPRTKKVKMSVDWGLSNYNDKLNAVTDVLSKGCYLHTEISYYRNSRHTTIGNLANTLTKLKINK